MTICDLDSGVGQLSRAFADLKERLVDIKAEWNDATLQQFEQVHLREIPSRMQLLVTAIERLSDFVDQAERDCADQPDE